MNSICIDHETKEAVTGIALSVFTDCVNAGRTFQDALLAVYMTGIENGRSALAQSEEK